METEELKQLIAAKNVDYSLLPGHLQDGMRRYVEHGVPPGGFLTAVLENDLMEAFKRADSSSQRGMLNIILFMYNEMPMGIYGSPELVKAWVEANRPKEQHA